MDCRITYVKVGGVKQRRGMTLVEMLVAMGVSGIVLLSLASLYLYSNRSFVTLKNHLDMDNASTRAMDYLSRDVRQADRLVAISSHRLTFMRGGAKYSFVFDPISRTLAREDDNGTTVLLDECDFMKFEMFQRTPLPGGSGFHASAVAGDCKVVRVTWFTSKLTGRSSANASSLRSAQIVLRNQKP